MWQNYASFAASAGEIRARLSELSSMQRMTEAYLEAYTLACRGGDHTRRVKLEVSSPASVDAE